ncbi:hypothetical protein GGI03_005359 [Coemansia sp. RSA 2337]|nr:hypothetical protein LPJ71_000735 [Coemansia sp. S17]KAJ2012112.1 hypothetical protein GGI14_005929 [Coemansia sp. S680]KAJ2026967.1 hypothetical protein H4S03_008455 [Coemansia sp. S3946]KAJ2040166.1 hypothetical protein H4S04_007963 [Coemansia sp. S16]KAJ2093816.1 hypothetical protein GGI16_005772 [Coemansia sp. S142-1]KAJ2095137.1 hypothetical protein IW146_010579 [Coemansia sp. RSA 922]KAJ2429006.1 hypothetical protein GGF41_001242 [Coemansia sp. RSA 2531]KAJ2460132.1 hypothetical pro
MQVISDQPISRHLAAQEWELRAPHNDAPESSQVTKRRRGDMCVSDCVTVAELLSMVFGVSGEQVTSEHLLVALGEVPFVSLGYVFDAYRHIYGCELMPRTIPSHECINTLARVVALEHWAPHLEGADSEDIAGLNILCRCDQEIGALRQSFLEEVGLAEDPHATVLRSQLCYVVVRMCAMSVKLLTGPVLSSIFLDVTRLQLHSLTVITEQCVWQIAPNKLCLMVESWAGNLGKIITEDFSMDDAHYAAKLCNAAYATRCGSASSNNTSVALDMLSNNKHNSRLLLGNQEAELDELSKRLFFVASTNTSPLIKVGLEQLAMPLRVLPSSA